MSWVTNRRTDFSFPRDRATIGVIAAIVVTILLVAATLLWQRGQTPAAAPAPKYDMSSLAPEVTPVTNHAIAEVMPRLTDPTRPFTVVVLGDSTGAAREGWVVQTARAMGARSGKDTKVHQWSVEAEPNGYLAPWGIAPGAQPGVTIWNASASGKNYEYTHNHWDEMIPIPGDAVDLVILNHGHNEPAGVMTSLTVRTMRKAVDQFPNAAIVATIQNPERPGSDHADIHAANMSSLKAAVTNIGGEVIDVESAYYAAEGWETMFDEGNLHPDQRGYDLWSGVIRQQLGL